MAYPFNNCMEITRQLYHRWHSSLLNQFGLALTVWVPCQKLTFREALVKFLIKGVMNLLWIISTSNILHHISETCLPAPSFFLFHFNGFCEGGPEPCMYTNWCLNLLIQWCLLFRYQPFYCPSCFDILHHLNRRSTICQRHPALGQLHFRSCKMCRQTWDPSWCWNYHKTFISLRSFKQLITYLKLGIVGKTRMPFTVSHITLILYT